MKSFFCRLMLIIALILVLAACNPENNPPAAPSQPVPIKAIGDGGLLTGSPCGPPCFFGMKPDATGYTASIDILSKSPDFKSCQEGDTADGGGAHEIKCENAFTISFTSDKKSLTYLDYQPASPITVQNVFDKLGEPKNLNVATGGDAKTVSKMWLFYPKYKMSILLADQDGDSFTITPDSKVQTVTYAGEKIYQAITDMAQSWSGFGKYLK
jgi:hypothetical protein